MNQKEPKDLKIAVFMGGLSAEREISLKSGMAVFNALKGLGLNALAVDVSSTDKDWIKQQIDNLDVELVFIALHGKFGEDGALQKILDGLGIVYTGSDSAASRRAMDKVSAKKCFRRCGLKVPQYLLSSDQEASDKQVIDKLGLPLIVKPDTCGSSIGMSLVKSQEDIALAISLAKKFDSLVIIEQFIKGRELTVGILGDQPLPPIEIITDEPFFNYQAKYQSSSTRYLVPAQLEQRVCQNLMQVGLIAHQSLGCRSFSRVDMILAELDLQPYILEVNTIPGLTERSLLPKAAKLIGLDFPQLCLNIIQSVKL